MCLLIRINVTTLLRMSITINDSIVPKYYLIANAFLIEHTGIKMVPSEACIGVIGIQDICHFTSRDIGYYPFYFQGYRIPCSISGILFFFAEKKKKKKKKPRKKQQ